MSNLEKYIEQARRDRERHEAAMAEEQRKIASTIPESELPCPRLELRWVNGGSYGRRCDYNIVIPIDKHDIREGSTAQHGSELRFCMGWTTVNGGREEAPMRGRVIDTPFRDSRHAAWDSYRIGFPAFVVFDGKAQSIVADKPIGEPIEAPENERSFGGKDWAHRESTCILVEAKNVIKRHVEKVRELRDQQPKGSWPWLYFNSMVGTLMAQADEIKDCHFTNFEDWVRFQTDDINIKVAKRVCSKCGADIPKDVTEACEHVFGETSRAFMAKE